MTRLSRFAFPRATLITFGLLALAMFGVAAIAEVGAGQDPVAIVGTDGPGPRELLRLCLGR